MSDTQRHKGVVFFPSYGHPTVDGRGWNLEINGLAFAPGKLTLRSKLVLKAMRRMMRAAPDAFESDIFQQRLAGFLALGQRGRRVTVRIGEQVFALPKKSKSNGLFRGSVQIDAESIEELRQSGGLSGNWLRFELDAADGQPTVEGRVQLLSNGGLSVISDIDDTIKLSAVHCKRTLLTYTFLRAFEAIDGMPRLYRNWADQGAAFHYVSSSPWQLFEPLAEFCESATYPEGTFHLRPFRIRDQMLARLFLLRRRGKGSVIHAIVKRFPNRRFVLVGDSGEKDPEIYAGVARRFPDSVSSIFIRNLPERPLDLHRCEKAFRRVRPDVCKVFHEVDELPRLLPMAEPALQGVS
jgi:phosphatidate phosphatase APP1